MPITQERFLSIIEAAQELGDCEETLRRGLELLERDIMGLDQSLGMRVRELRNLAQPQLQTLLLLAQEKAAIVKVYAGNDRRALRLRARRAMGDGPPSDRPKSSRITEEDKARARFEAWNSGQQLEQDFDDTLLPQALQAQETREKAAFQADKALKGRFAHMNHTQVVPPEVPLPSNFEEEEAAIRGLPSGKTVIWGDREVSLDNPNAVDPKNIKF